MGGIRAIHEWPEGPWGVGVVEAIAIQEDDNRMFKGDARLLGDWMLPTVLTPPTRTAIFSDITLWWLETWYTHEEQLRYGYENFPRTKICYHGDKGTLNPVDVFFDWQFYCVLLSQIKLDTSVYWQWVPFKFGYVQELLGIRADKYSKAVNVAEPGDPVRYAISLPDIPKEWGYSAGRYLVFLSLVTLKPITEIYNLRLLTGFRTLIWSPDESKWTVYSGPHALGEVCYYSNVAYQKIGVHASMIWAQFPYDVPSTSGCYYPQRIAFEPLYKINQLTSNLWTEFNLCRFGVIRIS